MVSLRPQPARKSNQVWKTWEASIYKCILRVSSSLHLKLRNCWVWNKRGERTKTETKKKKSWWESAAVKGRELMNSPSCSSEWGSMKGSAGMSHLMVRNCNSWLIPQRSTRIIWVTHTHSLNTVQNECQTGSQTNRSGLYTVSQTRTESAAIRDFERRGRAQNKAGMTERL